MKKHIELPPAVGRAFTKDMKAFFAEGDLLKRDVIAVRQLNTLKELQGLHESELRLSDVKAMFLEMKEYAWI